MPPYTTEPEERGGGRQKATAVVLLVLALAVRQLPSVPQQQLASLLRGTVLRPFVAVQESVAAARERRVAVDVLQARVDSLTVESINRRILEEENRRLRGLLEIGARLEQAYVPASVIRPRTVGSGSLFVLDVGASSGVRPDAPVITRHGLAGVVREVGPNSSTGIDWSHPDFSASAMDADGLTFGFAESRPGEFRGDQRLLFRGTAYHVDLQPGTLVVTSGLGSVYPRGVPLGRIQEVAERADGWRKSYWLEPGVDPGAVTHVLVAVGATAPDDLSGLWPADSVLGDAESVNLIAALRDSVARLEERLRAVMRDSTTAASDTLQGGRRP